jgi:hypothetical protein
MKNIPEKIYLQIGNDVPKDSDFNHLCGVTFEKEKINKNDIEYISVKKIKKAIKNNRYCDNWLILDAFIKEIGL